MSATCHSVLVIIGDYLSCSDFRPIREGTAAVMYLQNHRCIVAMVTNGVISIVVYPNNKAAIGRSGPSLYLPLSDPQLLPKIRDHVESWRPTHHEIGDPHTMRL